MSRGGLWRANPPPDTVKLGSLGFKSPVLSLGSFGHIGSGTESKSSGGMRRGFDHVGGGELSDDDGDGVTDTLRTAKGAVAYTRPAPVPVVAASVGVNSDVTKWIGYAALAVVAVLVVRKVKRMRKTRKARGAA